MFHRFSTWWRAFIVVLLSLTAIAWPSAAHAATTPSFSVVRQGAVATLSESGTAHFMITLKLHPANPAAVGSLSLYPRILTRSQLAPIISGAGSPSAAVASTGNFSLNCAGHGQMEFTIGMYTTRPGPQSSHCESRPLRLHLTCAGAACDGVYPLGYSVTLNGMTTTKWSLLAVQATAVAEPLRLNWIETLGPSSLVHSGRSIAVLKAIAAHPQSTLTLGADYRTLAQALQASTPRESAWLKALTRATSSPHHRVVAAPPGNIDFGGLVANGLSTQVVQQFTLTSRLLHLATGRETTAPVLLSGHPTLSGLEALAGVGVSNVVIPESTLTYAPSSSLAWGAPFHLVGAQSLTALSVDQPLSQLASDAEIEPGRRAALTLNTLAFLHFEEPQAPSQRSVIMVTSATDTSATYVNDLLDGLSRNPFVTASDVASSFSQGLVGANGAPTTRTLNASLPSTWSALNASSLATLIGSVTSFNQAVASTTVTDALSVEVAQSDIVGSPGNRQAAIDHANADLNAQLAKFSVDSDTITLAGPGTALPITLLSRANYTVTAVVHLITDRLSFPKGASVVTTLDSSTKSLRFPTANHRGSSLTLLVVVTTPNGQVVLAHAAIQVRIAGTSVVGYVLSFGSLFVLALWWWRTHRRRSRGRHAR